MKRQRIEKHESLFELANGKYNELIPAEYVKDVDVPLVCEVIENVIIHEPTKTFTILFREGRYLDVGRQTGGDQMWHGECTDWDEGSKQDEYTCIWDKTSIIPWK